MATQPTSALRWPPLPPLLPWDTIAGYVNEPTHVSRMVTLGHALATWLA